MNIPIEYTKVFDKLKTFSLDLLSIIKMYNKEQIFKEILILKAFFSILDYSILNYFAIYRLHEDEFNKLRPILLRILLECKSNILTIANNDFPEYMAFKYINHFDIYISKTQHLPQEIKVPIDAKIQQGLNLIIDSQNKNKAKEYLLSDKVFKEWYRPEKKKIIHEHESDVERISQKYFYSIYSLSAHACETLDFDIKHSLEQSSWYLLDIIQIIADYLDLDLKSEISELDELISKLAEGSRA